MIKNASLSLGNKFAIFLMVLLVIIGGIYSSAKLKLNYYLMLKTQLFLSKRCRRYTSNDTR